MIDLAHSFHMKGVGVDFVASGVVVMCEKGLFGNARLPQQMLQAYTSFMSWCKSKNLYSSCKPWDRLLDFDMSKLSDFPESIRGKGYDTGLGCKWLADILSSQARTAKAPHLT